VADCLSVYPLPRGRPPRHAGSGFVWYPKRFNEADPPSGSAVDLLPLQRQVVYVTDIPNLLAERYRILFTALADDVTAVPFDRPETSRRVRDACQAYGVALKPGTLAPSQVRLAGRRPCHTLIRCPACWSTVASAARGGRVALRKAALEV
jgi:hypothetical protein